MTEDEKKTIKDKIEDHSIYTEYRYTRWRARIFKRDGYACQFPGCKWPMGGLNAHHIHMKWYFPELIYSMKNGISLCKHHHTYVHKKGSDGYITTFTQIAEKNCKMPKISKKTFGKKKRRKKVTKKVSKKTKKVSRKKKTAKKITLRPAKMHKFK
jgi:hypothetical protein